MSGWKIYGFKKEIFNSFPILETERLVLRQLRLDEAPIFVEITSDNEIYKYMGHNGKGGYKTVEEAEQFINNMQTRFSPNKNAFIWSIALKHTNKPIGYLECSNFVRGSMATVAYWLSRHYWNQGMMTEALKVVVGFGFENVGFHRIQATVAVENIASIKALKKAGFIEEGILRQYELGKEFRDVLMLSILRDNYKATPYILHFEEAIRGKTRKDNLS